MKNVIMDTRGLFKLVELVKETKDTPQYEKELYNYFDVLHNRIREFETLINSIEHSITRVSK